MRPCHPTTPPGNRVTVVVIDVRLGPYGRHNTRPPLPHSPTLRYIAFMERGSHHEVHGTGEPQLLVYGTGSSLRVWDPVVDRLADRRSVIAGDLPGCARVPAYDDPALAAEVILGGSAVPDRVAASP
jgi:pimeloyl-ACP methyl ester carboxylesterase